MKAVLQKIVDRLVKPPVVVIAGPTASGKTSFSLGLARELIRAGKQVEIISADARQVYREIPIFSGAIREEEMQGVTHHLVGSEHVGEAKTAAWFKEEATRLIGEIHERGAIPVVVGGSAFWIQGILFEDDYPQVAPNESLRAELEALETSELQQELAQLDPDRYHNTDIDNRRRLIRSIEIAKELGHVPAMNYVPQKKWDVLSVYFNYPRELNKSRIRANVEARLEEGMEEEARGVYGELDEERFLELGLAYRAFEAHWRGDTTNEELAEEIVREETRYAKRQRTFFRKMFSRIRTPVIAVTDPAHREEILTQVLGHYSNQQV